MTKKREVLEHQEDVEDALARVSQIDTNQRRIAARSRDPHILHEVEDTRRAASGLRRFLLSIYPGVKRHDE